MTRYECFYTYAYPALNEVLATGSVFVIGAYTDMFNPDALRDLEDFIKRACSDSAFMEKQLKEELGEKGCCFSIPYGAYTPKLDGPNRINAVNRISATNSC